VHRILGVVAEYNPLHMGHLHHLKTARAESGCQYTVVAMSGNFVQRGEPALLAKGTRAAMALEAGADLVIEIPTYFVLQSAQSFARAGVALLANCGATVLSFGSESGKKEELTALAAWLKQELAQQRIREQMNLGKTYAAAVQGAVQATPEVSHLAPLLAGANDILAVEYIRAIDQFCPDIEILPVRRIGRESSAYKSASQLRAMLAKGGAETIKEHIPQILWPSFVRAAAKPVFAEDFSQALLYALLTMDAGQIRSLPACSEGLENRVLRAVRESRTTSQLIAAIKTKRYPRTRIQRLLMQALLQFHTIEYTGSFAPYLRILGCSARGRELLPLLAGHSKAPVLYSARDFDKICAPTDQLLRLDQRAADIYGLAGTDSLRDLSSPVGADCRNQRF
jgi:predicted nucleotidyltransferase